MSNNADYYRGVAYPEYFQTDWWRKLNDQLIDSKTDANCWICEKTNTLLLHHEKYTNLFAERLYRDVFVLCYTCHSRLHFSTVLFFFLRKTKLDYQSLKRRRLFLRLLFVLKQKRFGSAVWYLFRYLVCL